MDAVSVAAVREAKIANVVIRARLLFHPANSVFHAHIGSWSHTFWFQEALRKLAASRLCPELSDHTIVDKPVLMNGTVCGLRFPT